MTVSADAAPITVRDVRGLAELEACERLYARVMGLRPGDGSINPRLLIALQENSGLVLGAFAAAGADPVGFTYSFLARDEDGALYQYSQLAVVADEAQGRGVGRALKLAQRAATLARGISTIRLAYDPLRARNGHFNLDVLGAVADRFVPDMYGERGFGADGEDRTDRLIVRWDLAAEPAAHHRFGAPPVGADRSPGAAYEAGAHRFVTVPAQWQRWRGAAGAGAGDRVRHAVREAMSAALADGLVAASCVAVDDDLAVYRFVPHPS